MSPKITETSNTNNFLNLLSLSLTACLFFIKRSTPKYIIAVSLKSPLNIYTVVNGAKIENQRRNLTLFVT